MEILLLIDALYPHGSLKSEIGNRHDCPVEHGSSGTEAGDQLQFRWM